MTPSVSLTYNSSSGQGHLGIGWGIGGLSAITRCSQNLAQDGVVRGVKYDSQDKFCLDGQRLVPVSPGASEYRTEIDSFQKIVAVGSTSTGPVSFKVWAKSGEIIEYGNTADSRIEADGTSVVRVWAVNKKSDRRSNYLTYSYYEWLGDYRVTRIDYGGNESAYVTPRASIRFQYISRPDNLELYQVGSLIKISVRLSKVQAYYGSSKVREYSLGYETSPATYQSRIESIQECAFDAETVCLPPVTFGWLDSAGTLSNGGSAATNTLGDFYNDEDRIYVSDVTGDGRADIVVGPSTAGNRWVLPSNGSGFGSVQSWASGKYGNWAEKPDRVHIMDINADGKSDVVIGPSSSGNWWVMHSTGSSFSDKGLRASSLYGDFYDDPGRIFRAVELDGDGYPEIVIGPSSAGNWFVVQTDGTNLTAGKAQGPYDYVPNSPDYTTSPASSSIILQTTAPASGYISQLAAYTGQINAASIPYSIFSSNSNSFAYQGIESLGLPRPSTQGFAPAAQSVLGY